MTSRSGMYLPVFLRHAEYFSVSWILLKAGITASIRWAIDLSENPSTTKRMLMSDPPVNLPAASDPKTAAETSL